MEVMTCLMTVSTCLMAVSTVGVTRLACITLMGIMYLVFYLYWGGSDSSGSSMYVWIMIVYCCNFVVCMGPGYHPYIIYIFLSNIVTELQWSPLIFIYGKQTWPELTLWLHCLKNPNKKKKKNCYYSLLQWLYSLILIYEPKEEHINTFAVTIPEYYRYYISHASVLHILCSL